MKQNWHPAMAPSNGTTPTPPKLAVTLPPNHSTLQWHLQWHHPQSWPSPSPPLAHYNGTLQWHPAMAPRPLPQSWSSPSPLPTIAHYNGTLQSHPAMAPRPLPQSWSSPSPSTTVHYNGTLRWHPAMAPRPLHPAMAPWCHVQSAKVVRRPPPFWK